MVQLLKEMEEYAKENNIPIMMDDIQQLECV